MIVRYLNKRTSYFVFTVALLLIVGMYFQNSFPSYAASTPNAPSSEPAAREETGATEKPPSTAIWTSPIENIIELQQKRAKITKLSEALSEPLPKAEPQPKADLEGEAGQEAEPVQKTEPMKPTSEIVSKSGLSELHIAELFKGTALAGQALEKPILEIEEKYGINAYFTIAAMKLESGHGRSRLAQHKNNLFGLNAIDGDAFDRALDFPTKGDCVREFGRIIAQGYLDKGYTTVEKVARKYCSANSRWAGLVKSIMRSDHRKAVDLSV